jgi:uncharacterized protein
MKFRALLIVAWGFIALFPLAAQGPSSLAWAQIGTAAEIPREIQNGNMDVGEFDYGMTRHMYAAWHNSNPEMTCVDKNLAVHQQLLAATQGGENSGQTTQSPRAQTVENTEHGQSESTTSTTQSSGGTYAFAEDALQRAARSGTLQDVQRALKAGADVNAKNNEGTTALMQAAGSNGPDVVSLLLQAGADASAKDNIGLTALAYAQQNTAVRNTSAYQQLLAATRATQSPRAQTVENTEHGQSESTTSSTQSSGGTYTFAEQTDLAKLAQSRTPGQVQQAINDGADVNAIVDKDGGTALMWAADNRNPDVTSVLLRAGANVNARDNKGVSALLEATTVENNSKVILVLLQAGADANVSYSAGGTTIDNAIAHNPEAIPSLARAGGNVNGRGIDGDPVLMGAIYQHPNAVQALLDAGANPNATSKGMPALIYAAALNKAAAVSALLRAGADASAKMFTGATALDVARNTGNLRGTEAYQELVAATERSKTANSAGSQMQENTPQIATRPNSNKATERIATIIYVNSSSRIVEVGIADVNTPSASVGTSIIVNPGQQWSTTVRPGRPYILHAQFYVGPTRTATAADHKSRNVIPAAGETITWNLVDN